jgi:succinate dehydrogenase hydrophobic anchor subunit
MMCAGCVAQAKDADAAPRTRSDGAVWMAFAAGGIFLAWLTFYYLGMMLARVPSDFFE